MATPNVDRGNKYARDVVAGDIPACKWVRLACQRHLDDLRTYRKKGGAFYFDKLAAERVLKFKQLFPHVKGKWAAKRELVRLSDWQCFFNLVVFGWKRANGTRRYRRVILIVPRKNGKSFEAATTGLYMLAADNEHGAEVYSGASTEKQALEVFKPAWLMASKTQEFLDFFDVDLQGNSKNPSTITCMETGSSFKTMIGKPADGASPSCAIIDEYHEHDTSDQLDTMETGMLAREQPLLLIITTAGDNVASPCYSLQLDAQKMLEGVNDNGETFALIYTIDKGDDWATLEAVKKANPNFGVSINPDVMANKLLEAKSNPRKQNAFLTKHLNVWVGSRNAFFNIDRFNNSGEDLNIADFYGMQCYIGLDLSSKIDIAAVNVLIPLGDSDYITFGFYYLPEAQVENSNNDHYKAWANEGRLILTDGEIIDYSRIKEDILKLKKDFRIAEVAYDPWGATMLITELMDEGVNVVEFAATVKNFSEPMKTLDGLIRARRIRHNRDPILTWGLSNVVSKTDRNDNEFPTKDRPENKIDPAVALIMSLGRAIVGNSGANDAPMVWGSIR